jgi:tetratricopeptide (TPR) repeat protein
MNGYVVWLLWIAGFALLSLGLLARLFVGWRMFSPVQRGAVLVYLTLCALGAGLGAYQLLNTPSALLEPPIGNPLFVVSVIAFFVLLGIAINEAYAWDSWRLARRGATLLAARKNAQALAVYARLLKRRNYRATGWSGKAVALQSLGRPHEALSCADEALRLTPRQANVWLVKGMALLSLQQQTEGLIAINHASVLAPRDATIWATKGDALERTGRHAEAREAAEQALALLGKSGQRAWRASALATIAFALVAEGRPAEALTRTDEAITIYPQASRAPLAKAMALKNMGRFAEMRTVAEQGLSIIERHFANAPDHADLWQIKARFLRLLDREDEAAKAEEHRA